MLCTSCIPSPQRWSIFPLTELPLKYFWWGTAVSRNLLHSDWCLLYTVLHSPVTASKFMQAQASTGQKLPKIQFIPRLWLNWHFRLIGWRSWKTQNLRANLHLVLHSKRSWFTKWKESAGVTFFWQLKWAQLKVVMFHGYYRQQKELKAIALIPAAEDCSVYLNPSRLSALWYQGISVALRGSLCSCPALSAIVYFEQICRVELPQM